MILLLLSATALAAEQEAAPPLKVTALDYSHSAGISYDPHEPLSIDVSVTNQSGEAISLADARWRVTLGRERMIGPRKFWNARFQDVQTVAEGVVEGVPGRLDDGEAASLGITFEPGRYGFFFLMLDPDGDGESWLRVCGTAVVRPPAPGTKPRSYYQADNIFRNPEAMAQILGRYGIKKIRVNARLAPDRRSDGTYGWDRVDRVMQPLRKHDVLAQAALMPVGFFDPPTIGGKVITYWGGQKSNLIAKRRDLGPVDKPGTFAHFVRALLTRYDDTVHMAIIRNEPWEGGSISNWHATSAYMREVLTIARQVIDEAGVDVELVGTDSIDNTIDQVAIAEQTHLLDGVTHHPYQLKFRSSLSIAQSAGWGLPVYDNESWLAPEDMAIITANTMQVAEGYRLVHSVHAAATMPALGNSKREIICPRPIGQAIGTWLHFIEDTEHAEELHPDTFPHVHLFKGREAFADKHVAVVFGRVKLYGHRAHNAGVGDEVFPQLRGDGTLTITDPDSTLHVFDMFGNALPREGDRLTLPLDEYPYYLTSTGGYGDLRSKLAELSAEYNDAGIELAMLDMTEPLDARPQVRVRVSNRVPTEQTVTVGLAGPEGWRFAEPERSVSLAPGQSEVVAFRPERVKPSPLNSYAFSATATTPGGVRELGETLHVSVFEKGTPVIDGDLAEWAELGAVPTYMSGEPIEVDYQQQMWFPTLDIQGRNKNDVWVRFASMWDDDYFYIAAEVHDPTVSHTRLAGDGDMSLTHGEPYDYLYWQFAIPGFAPTAAEEHKFDGLKIAFNVLPVGEKEDPLFPKDAQKRMNTRFHRIGPDYEYDLYLGQKMALVESYETVKARHLARLEDPPNDRYAERWPPFEPPAFRSVGEPIPELWRRIAPGVPRHRYYPFSPRRPRDQGVVETAKLKVIRDGDVVRYEAAIPWSELARVEPQIGKEVSFAYFVWDRDKLALDWAKDRSIAYGAQQVLIPFKRTSAIETPWRFIDAIEGGEADAP